MRESCRNPSGIAWQRLFSPKVPLAPGNFDFLFLAPALNFSKCPRPKTGQNTTKSPFPTGGGSTEKEVVAQKVDTVATFFFDFGPPVALGPRRGPAGLACLLLLLARR